MDDDDDDNDHVDEVRLRLWTTATKGSLSRWYMSTEKHGGMIQTGKTDSYTRALRQSYQKSRLVAKQEKLAKEKYEFSLQRCATDLYRP
jgi:hypothetical protein